MSNMKKDFQKAVKAYRDTLPDVTWYLGGDRTEQHRPEIPKAMMTAQQMRKGTATINCGRGEYGKALAPKVAESEQFVAWCEAYGIKTVQIEIAKEPSYMKPQYQIRVTY